jgi:hypothetical protein
VGDAIRDILYARAFLKDGFNNDSFQIEELEEKIKECWAFFNSISPTFTTPKDEYLYVDSGIDLNGERLYKRIKIENPNTK